MFIFIEYNDNNSRPYGLEGHGKYRNNEIRKKRLIFSINIVKYNNFYDWIFWMFDN